jgi:hypothetical protein
MGLMVGKSYFILWSDYGFLCNCVSAYLWHTVVWSFQKSLCVEARLIHHLTTFYIEGVSCFSYLISSINAALYQIR